MAPRAPLAISAILGLIAIRHRPASALLPSPVPGASVSPRPSTTLPPGSPFPRPPGTPLFVKHALGFGRRERPRTCGVGLCSEKRGVNAPILTGPLSEKGGWPSIRMIGAAARPVERSSRLRAPEHIRNQRNIGPLGPLASVGLGGLKAAAGGPPHCCIELGGLGGRHFLAGTTAGSLFRGPRNHAGRRSSRVNGRRGHGEISGSSAQGEGGITSVNDDDDDGEHSSSATGGDSGEPGNAGSLAPEEEPLPSAAAAAAAAASAAATFDAEKIAAAGEREDLAGMHPLDYVYAVMPDVQDSLKEKTGWEGTGAGYEDVRVGFYRDTNLKPMNWRDAMVSMKPGSGTMGLDPDFDDHSGSPAEVERRRRRRASAASAAAASGGDPAAGEKCFPKERTGTRYGGPTPGTHGPWRWDQLVKGSTLEKRLKAEVASFPRRLRRGLRRYFDDKVVWVTGADHGIGEQLAINLSVNGARVILSGTDIDELERVQRLCILAWMKAVDWEILKALYYGLTRLDRVMILPLDVRDHFILGDAAEEAEGMLGRPMDMVFHCQTDGVDGHEGDEDEDWEEDDGPVREGGGSSNMRDRTAEQAMSATLFGAVGLTKVLLPSMLDKQGGHVVIFGGNPSLSSPTWLEEEEEEEREERPSASPPPPSPSASAEAMACQLAVRGYFDSLRAEVARDRVRVTTAFYSHPNPRPRHGSGEQPPSHSAGEGGTSRRACSPAAAAGPAPNASIAARIILAAVARGRPEVLIQKRGFWGLAGVMGRARGVAKALKTLLLSR